MKRAVNVLGRIDCGKRMHILFALCATTAVALPAQTLTTLHSFDGTDGKYPVAGLVQGTDGNFYGTTEEGGANCAPQEGYHGCGTVFKITPAGTLATLYSLCSQGGCADGAYPTAGLVQANGDFYGTTAGGAGDVSNEGTVFTVTPSGTLTTLYSFNFNGTDGAEPDAGLIQATDGDFYGTTRLGGLGNGTIFKITASGTLTTLYSFCPQSGCMDGKFPLTGLVQATDGGLYGTTLAGGASNFGTVFKITTSGTLTTLYNFCSQEACADGGTPEATLVQASNGDLYGTTGMGGTGSCIVAGTNYGVCGTVFKISPSGALTTVYSFCSQGVYPDCPDGLSPMAGLAQATDGDLYGTTEFGGANSCITAGTNYGCGTIFKITASGSLTTLYNFCSQTGCSDGYSPLAGLIQATNGNFYGTTQYGGADAYGTVFSLSVGLGPAVPVVNAGGVLNSGSYTTEGVAQGSIVSIFGTNLAASTASASAIPLPTTLSDVTSVTFNGIPAGLYFVSQNQINAQLPFNVLPPGQDSGTMNVMVTRSNGTSAPQNITVAPASPGIFTTTANGLGQAFAYDNTTGDLAAPVGAPIGPFTTSPISVSSGHALIIACTGLGSVNPSIDDYLAASDGILRYTVLTPTVLIGDVAATPIYSVLSPQFVSEYQIGVTPAANTPTGDAVSLQIQIGGVTTSNQVTIAVAP
jgi:uncharacterized protein (TIGR03437 family)